MASVAAKSKPQSSDDEWEAVTPPSAVPVATASSEDEWEPVEASAAPVTKAATPPAAAARPRATPGNVSLRPPTVPDRGFWGELGAQFNPKEIAAGMGERGINLLMSLMDPTGGPDSLPRDEQSNRGLDMTDLGAPDLPAVYQEASRRGQANESLAGMYGSATGQALLAGLVPLATRIGAGGRLGTRPFGNRLPERIATAESRYGEAVGADPSMTRKMMDRGVVVESNPAAQAATASENAAARLAERKAIPATKPTKGARGRFEGDPQRAELATEAKFQTDMAKILEVLPESRSLAGAAGRGATRFGTSRLNWLGYSAATGAGVSPFALGPIGAAHLLRTVSTELVKTNAWKTAAPLYRYRFMNAVLRGDANAAAATGALIASGEATASATPTTTTTSISTPTPTPIPADTERDTGKRLNYEYGSNEESTRLPPSVPRQHTMNMSLEELVPPSLWFSSFDHKLTADSSGVLPREKARARENSPKFTKIIRLPNTEEYQEDGGYYLPHANIIGLGPEITGNPAKHEQTLPHEVGHALWSTTLPSSAKQQWTHIHNQNRKKAEDPDYEFLIHPAFERYWDDPDHSFAEFVGQFVGYPEQLKVDEPRIYAWLKSVLGREYITRTKKEGSNPSAILPYYHAGRNPQP